jgi:large subunit ribosomal protein L4
MKSPQTFTSSGNKATSKPSLDVSVFAAEDVSDDLVHKAYVAYLANGRQNLAQSKTRGLVRGGGRKPWKQKGTGRARFGSIRNPIWRGGGIVFGPTGQENYTKKMHTSTKRQALRIALTRALGESRLLIVEKLVIKTGKTKDFAHFVQKIGASGNVLIATTDLDEPTARAIQNMSNVQVAHAHYLNVYDLTNADCVILTNDAVAYVNQWLSTKKSADNKEAK